MNAPRYDTDGTGAFTYWFGGNAPWDTRTPLGARISRQGYNVKIMLGRVIVTVGKYKTNMMVRNDEIRCYCREGLERVILSVSVRLE